MKLFRSGQSSSFSNFHLGKCTTNFDGEEGVLAISVGILFWIGALPAVGDALGDHRVARFLAEFRSRKWQNSVRARVGAVAHLRYGFALITGLCWSGETRSRQEMNI